MKEVILQEKQMNVLKASHINFCNERKRVHELLTDNKLQFKKRRIDKKVRSVKDSSNRTITRPNIFERRTGQTLTPLMLGKIQYHKMKMAYNMRAVQEELKV